MKDELSSKLSPHDQQHVLQFWDELSAAEQSRLAEQVRSIDFEQFAQIVDHHAGNDITALARRAEGPPAIRLGSSENRFLPGEARDCGAEVLAAGKVGVLLVAGGQGTRLGFEHPKGLYPIGAVSGASLLQIHLEKILATSRQYGVTIPLYLMTSRITHDETVAFLAENEQFGLSDDVLHLFCQGEMPAVDAVTGRLLLADKGQLAMSPDGHGGMLAALSLSGDLADMQSRGIEHVFYLQVDNPAVGVCDEEFIGYHVLSGSEASTQVVAKRSADERVGNVVAIDGKIRIIEYSDMPAEIAAEHDAAGRLKLWAGNTAVHVFDTSLLARAERDTASLPWHIAHKKVPHVDSQGQRVDVAEPNAFKFERFIFDLLPAASGGIVMEIDPAVHYAPVKNADGAADATPAACRERMVALHTTWLREAGVTVEEGTPVEISPLYARSAEQVRERVSPEMLIRKPTYLRP
jgi:UDP-N-acetylglucosamine/UDP-N-acetylgalactosamine diphosphorylase